MNSNLVLDIMLGVLVIAWGAVMLGLIRVQRSLNELSWRLWTLVRTLDGYEIRADETDESGDDASGVRVIRESGTDSHREG